MQSPPPGGVRADHGRAVRTDIQALRAFAVLAVVLFHLWPIALPGGFVGVDVFFVISGFLITGQLVRARERGALRLGAFWAARARRLLPASLVVLLASVALTLIWAPETLAGQYLRSIIGSTLYVENWLLAIDGNDYLAHDNQPPIAQHYWSLGVEEQFYVLWPLLLIVGTLGWRRSRTRSRRPLLVGAAVLGAASFSISVWLTAANYPFGYFSTPSRIWEFAVGAIIALLPAARLHRAVQAGAWLVGAAGLVGTALLFDADVAFPGPWAIVPVVATAMIIAAGPAPETAWHGKVAGFRPLQWLGDQSYGIYLWHWPLVVIAPSVLGRPPRLVENLAILAVTVLLAAATKRLVEDPIRFGRSKALRARSVGLITVGAMALVVAAAGVPMAVNAHADASRQAAAEAELRDPQSCRGASALLVADCATSEESPVDADALVPSLAGLLDDTGGAFSCYDADVLSGGEPTSCTFGSDRDDALRIALNGDSHAAMLIPGLRLVAEERNWSVETYVGRGCVWQMPAEPGCESRNAEMSERLLSGRYDVLLTASLNSADFDDQDRAVRAERLAGAWSAAEQAGLEVIPLADNPAVPPGAQECVSSSTSFSLSTCAFSESESLLAVDPMRTAADAADVPLVDLSQAYCTDVSCSMVLGGVLVYRDDNHITATFSRTLAPYLADGIAAVLGEE